MIGPALGMAEDDRGRPGVLEHFRGNVSGMGSAHRPMAVLCTNHQPRSHGLAGQRADEGRRRADHGIHPVRETLLTQPLAHTPGLAERRLQPVHLPVPRH